MIVRQQNNRNLRLRSTAAYASSAKFLSIPQYLFVFHGVSIPGATTHIVFNTTCYDLHVTSRMLRTASSQVPRFSQMVNGSWLKARGWGRGPGRGRGLRVASTPGHRHEPCVMSHEALIIE